MNPENQEACFDHYRVRFGRAFVVDAFATTFESTCAIFFNRDFGLCPVADAIAEVLGAHTMARFVRNRGSRGASCDRPPAFKPTAELGSWISFLAGKAFDSGVLRVSDGRSAV